MVGGGDPFCLKFCGKLTLLERNDDLQSIFARSASAVTPSEKVQLTLTGSPLRAFQE